jgi:hypothetical protein
MGAACIPHGAGIRVDEMTTLTRIAFLAACLLLSAPLAAGAHDGDRDGRSWHHRHHRFVALAGTVTSVDAGAGTIVVDVARASRRIDELEGDKVTVEADRVRAPDANDDGEHTLADIAAGDKVIVFAKRRKVDVADATVADANVFAARRDGGCDHHD